MKFILAVATISIASLLISECKNRDVKLSGSTDVKLSSSTIDQQSLLQNKDSIYRMYFGSGEYLQTMYKHDAFREVGDSKIPVIKFWGKEMYEPHNKQLQPHGGYYYDTIQAGVVHKYQLPGSILWINSASVIGLSPACDTIKLKGEGYFETTDKVLTILIKDTIKVIVNRNSKVNVNAYEIPLNTDGHLTRLAQATLLKGDFKVINGTDIETVKAPNNFAYISSGSVCDLLKASTIKGADSWTKLKFDYKDIDINELIERFGRRCIVPVETWENCVCGVGFTGSFEEPLQQLINRLDTMTPELHCRLINNKIILSHK